MSLLEGYPHFRGQNVHAIGESDSVLFIKVFLLETVLLREAPLHMLTPTHPAGDIYVHVYPLPRPACLPPSLPPSLTPSLPSSFPPSLPLPQAECTVSPTHSAVACVCTITANVSAPVAQHCHNHTVFPHHRRTLNSVLCIPPTAVHGMMVCRVGIALCLRLEQPALYLLL